MSLTFPLPRLLPYPDFVSSIAPSVLVNWANFYVSAFSRFKGLAEAPEPWRHNAGWGAGSAGGAVPFRPAQLTYKSVQLLKLIRDYVNTAIGIVCSYQPRGKGMRLRSWNQLH